MNKITLWYRFDNLSSVFKYDHYEDGWDTEIVPKNVVIDGDSRWAREIAYMDGSTVKHMDEI